MRVLLSDILALSTPTSLTFETLASSRRHGLPSAWPASKVNTTFVDEIEDTTFVDEIENTCPLSWHSRAMAEEWK
jgi:hypothetical protein